MYEEISKLVSIITDNNDSTIESVKERQRCCTEIQHIIQHTKTPIANERVDEAVRLVYNLYDLLPEQEEDRIQVLGMIIKALRPEDTIINNESLITRSLTFNDLEVYYSTKRNHFLVYERGFVGIGKQGEEQLKVKQRKYEPIEFKRLLDRKEYNRDFIEKYKES